MDRSNETSTLTQAKTALPQADTPLNAGESAQYQPSVPTSQAVRQAPINPNHWYAVALSTELTDQPLGVTLWGQPVVLYRIQQKNQQSSYNQNFSPPSPPSPPAPSATPSPPSPPSPPAPFAPKIQALEDRCPHRQVRLSHGQVQGEHIECIYHGWQFNGSGACTNVPYLTPQQRLPSCRLRTYPVREQNGFIWIFPGDVTRLEAEQIDPLPIPEWAHLNYIASVATIDVNAHFSFLIENLMDMYHGRLHDDLQAWANPVLQTIDQSPTQIDAHYAAETYYKIDKIWSVSQLFFPSLRKLRPTHLDVSYLYPHWRSVLGKDFKIYCLFCPIGPTQTKAYLLHFTSLNAFHRLHKLPVWFRRFIKDSLFNSAQGLLDGLVRQDVLMMENEQKAFETAPNQKGPEFNPVISTVQKLITAQGQG